MWELYFNRVMVDLGCSVDYFKFLLDFVVCGLGNYEFNVEVVIFD